MTLTWWCPGCGDGFDLDADEDTPPICRDCRVTLPPGYQAERGRSHLPDPVLGTPFHDWLLDPWGWTIHTRCGLVLQRCRPALSADDVCHKCAAKALRL